MVIYIKNDGIYFLNKNMLKPVEFINKFTNVNFSDETVIEKINISDDYDFCLGYNEFLEAELLVPNDEVLNLFPEEIRDYDPEYMVDLRSDDDDGVIWFSVWTAEAVTKWFDKTSRTIFFTVLKSDNQYTKIYVFVDRLGWNA